MPIIVKKEIFNSSWQNIACWKSDATGNEQQDPIHYFKNYERESVTVMDVRICEFKMWCKDLRKA
jgi:hypothetical protein